jgi:hypothetical protein
MEWRTYDTKDHTTTTFDFVLLFLSDFSCSQVHISRPVISSVIYNKKYVKFRLFVFYETVKEERTKKPKAEQTTLIF